MRDKVLEIITKLDGKKHPLVLEDVLKEITSEVRNALNQLTKEGLIEVGKTINNQPNFWLKK